jgi:hypothetical protein
MAAQDEILRVVTEAAPEDVDAADMVGIVLDADSQ